jgi:asparagine synthase (glutamine-hydrolysing)
MCGILGHFAFGRPISSQLDELVAQINALRHRGPDDGAWWADGPFIFGHRRLSIIDLNSGRQPMASSDGRFVVTFNGEIYNYVELRDELRSVGYQFRTDSDTEVLLHGYHRWGTELPARLKGMFAFGIADRQEQQLFLARDRFGEKPLLYAEQNSAVTFASEMRALASLTFIERDLDEAALRAYLCLNYVPGDATMVSGIRRLAPAAWRLYGVRGLIAAARYWHPPVVEHDGKSANLTEREACERLEELLDQSVRIALRSDVPVGIFLSSGIDSSLVAMSALRSGRLSHAYCLAMPDDRGYSEWDGAARTARRLGLKISKVVLQPGVISDFFDTVEHADDPLADSSALAVFTLAKYAAQHTKVVIGGDGGDELFCGYLTYQATLLHELVVAKLPASMRTALTAMSTRFRVRETKVSLSYKLWRFLRAADLPSNVAHFTWNGTWLPREAMALSRVANDDGLHVLHDLAVRHGLQKSPTVAELQRADISDYLANDILAKADRMSMAHGLEIRSPFLDPDIVAFALSLPARMKVSLTGGTKRILRTLARNVYGSNHAYARKQGFSIPIHSWLRGPARHLVLDLLAAGSVDRLGVFDSEAVQRAVRAHLDGKRSYGFELWGLMVLVAWHRARMESPRPVPAQASLPPRIDIPCTAVTL